MMKPNVYSTQPALRQAQGERRRYSIASWKPSFVTSIPRHTNHFFQRSGAGDNPAQTIVAQIEHTSLHCVVAQMLFAFARVDHAAQDVVHLEQFVNTGAAAIAGLVAFGAADGTI